MKAALRHWCVSCLFLACSQQPLIVPIFSFLGSFSHKASGVVTFSLSASDNQDSLAVPRHERTPEKTHLYSSEHSALTEQIFVEAMSSDSHFAVSKATGSFVDFFSLFFFFFVVAQSVEPIVAAESGMPGLGAHLLCHAAHSDGNIPPLSSPSPLLPSRQSLPDTPAPAGR